MELDHQRRQRKTVPAILATVQVAVAVQLLQVLRVTALRQQHHQAHPHQQLLQVEDSVWDCR